MRWRRTARSRRETSGPSACGSSRTGYARNGTAGTDARRVAPTDTAVAIRELWVSLLPHFSWMIALVLVWLLIVPLEVVLAGSRHLKGDAENYRSLLAAGEPACAALHLVRHDLHLARERQHVGAVRGGARRLGEHAPRRLADEQAEAAERMLDEVGPGRIARRQHRSARPAQGRRFGGRRHYSSLAQSDPVSGGQSSTWLRGKDGDPGPAGRRCAKCPALSSLVKDAAKSYGVVVNPKKSEKVTFAAGDQIIVLAEE